MTTVKVVSAAVVLLGLSGMANADIVFGDYSTYPMMSISAVEEMDGYVGPLEFDIGTLYSNMDPGPNGHVAFAPATGQIGFDDYDTGFSGMQLLDSYRFAGGVDAAGGVLFFDFFDTSNNFIDGFGLALSQGGNYIYTISGGGGTPIGTLFDSAGIHTIVADDGTLGQWFLGDAGPSVGSEDPFFGSVADGTFSHTFELNGIPAPSTFALLGLGGLVATRRRR